MFEPRINQETFLKAKVECNVKNQLIEGVMAKNDRDREDWIDFIYEKLCNFCYFYGKVGHEEDQCLKVRGGNYRSLELG